MTKRLLIILGVFLTALVLTTLVFNNFGGQKRSYSKVTINVQDPWLHNEDVYFYTGSFFAKYDTNSNSISRLSDYLFIQNGIGSVSWLEDSVVFQTSPSSSDRDDVTTAAQQLGAKPYQSHWWKYDFKTKQYQLITLSDADNCDSLTQLSSMLLACVSPQNSGTGSVALRLLNLSSKSSKSVFTTDDDIVNVAADDKSVYFVTSGLNGNQSLHAVGLNSLNEKKLFSSNGQVAYYAYGGQKILVNEVGYAQSKDLHADAVRPKSSKQKLVLLDDGKAVLDKTVKSLPISLFSNDDGEVLFSSLDSSVKRIREGKVETLAKPAKPELARGDFLFSAQSKLFIVTPGGELSSSPPTPRKDNSKYPSSFNTKSDNDKTGNSFVDVESGGSQDVFLYLPNVSSSQQQQAVGDMLAQKGFKPSEFNFTWFVDGVDFHAPISPNAIIIK